jgi:hypothetical protein
VTVSNSKELIFVHRFPLQGGTRHKNFGSRPCRSEASLSQTEDRRPAQICLPRQSERPDVICAHPAVKRSIECHAHHPADAETTVGSSLRPGSRGMRLATVECAPVSPGRVSCLGAALTLLRGWRRALFFFRRVEFRKSARPRATSTNLNSGGRPSEAAGNARSIPQARHVARRKRRDASCAFQSGGARPRTVVARKPSDRIRMRSVGTKHKKRN